MLKGCAALPTEIIILDPKPGCDYNKFAKNYTKSVKPRKKSKVHQTSGTGQKYPGLHPVLNHDSPDIMIDHD